MQAPPSEHFTPLDLRSAFNANRTEVEGFSHKHPDDQFGARPFLGIPFTLGERDRPNGIVLEKDPVTIDIDPICATYLIFVHVVEDRFTNYQDGFADHSVDGNELGQHVSDYMITFADGETANTPIHRRFAIQQTHLGWGASAFTAMPMRKPAVNLSTNEKILLGGEVQGDYGNGECRHASGRDQGGERLWIYALANPRPDEPITRITLQPREERSLIYAISHTQLTDHPLRPGTRQKLRLTLPDSVALNNIDEYQHLDIDLGSVISARAVLDYDAEQWQGDTPNVQPVQSEREVIVEYIAHPKAKLYVGSGNDQDPPLAVYDLAQAHTDAPLITMAPANRPVKIKVVEKGSTTPVAVRFHAHGPDGEYLPPKGNHRKVNTRWFQDNYGEFAIGANQYAYIPGTAVIDLPLGEVFVHITKGYEVTPVRERVTITPDTEELTFELDRVLDWRANGWVTADTHVHFLSPTTARLEGEAEGVNVVNLLASQWGEMFSNVSDFDGKTTLGAKEFGGDGEFMVRVGTENRMQVLGHISLLGYSGEMILPLCSGGPTESAIGDAQEVTMAEWAQQCIEQKGLVVMPHGPNPQCERAADIVLGLIHAMEMMTQNPQGSQLSPYGIADWYRYLNLGYQLPVVGGSDKMAAGAQLGGVRTYAHLGDQEFTYDNWMHAVRAGNTFVTVGPLAAITVEGQVPGTSLKLPGNGGTVNVTWKVESVSLPIDQVEIIVGGLVHEELNFDKTLEAKGSAEIPITDSTWIALRVRGSYKGQHGEIAAHTSAVHVLVQDKPLFSKPDAMDVLNQIEGAMAYLDTLAPRPEADRLRKMRATLEAAHNRMHQQMHKHGIYHDHTPLHHHHEHDHDHEH